MKFQKKEILHSVTNQTIFTVTSERSSLSGKRNRFVLNKHWTARPMGSFRFSSMETSKIEYDVNGAANKMTDQTMLSSSKWSYSPVSYPNKEWTWNRKHETFTLTDEGGMKVASIVDGNLVLEPLGFHEMAVDEVVLSAYAMWQKRRRDKGDAEEAEGVAEVIGAVLGG